MATGDKIVIGAATPVDNLTSTSTTSSLSANQGRVLNVNKLDTADLPTELDNVAAIRAHGNLPAGANLNDYTSNGTWLHYYTDSIVNPPATATGTAVLSVVTPNAGTDVVQRYTVTDTSDTDIINTTYIREGHAGTWGEWQKVPDTSDFTGISATNGEQWFPNGTVMRWGYIGDGTAGSAGNGGDVVFSTAFNTLFNVSLTVDESVDGSGATASRVSAKSASGFSYQCYVGSSGTAADGVFWTAIGN